MGSLSLDFKVGHSIYTSRLSLFIVERNTDVTFDLFRIQGEKKKEHCSDISTTKSR